MAGQREKEEKTEKERWKETEAKLRKSGVREVEREAGGGVGGWGGEVMRGGELAWKR